MPWLLRCPSKNYYITGAVAETAPVLFLQQMHSIAVKGEREMARKFSGRAVPMPVGIAVGIGIALVVTLVLSMVIAYLIHGETIPETSVGYCVMGMLLIASAVGAWMAAKMAKRRWMVACLCAGAGYFVLLLAMNALFFGGQYQGVGVTLLLCLGGAGTVGFLGLREGNHGIHKRKIRRFR